MARKKKGMNWMMILGLGGIAWFIFNKGQQQKAAVKAAENELIGKQTEAAAAQSGYFEV